MGLKKSVTVCKEWIMKDFEEFYQKEFKEFYNFISS